MTTTFQSTDSIGAGVRFTLAAAGDDYFVFKDVTVASTDSNAIFSSFANTSITVHGSAYAASTAILLNTQATGSTIYVGETGIIGNTNSSESAVTFLNAADTALINHGQIASATAIGVLAGAINVDIQNFGSISGASGVLSD
jgi:hypothetical protein